MLAYTFGANVFERPDGVIIAGLFTLAILTFSGLSRIARSLELRVEQTAFDDDESRKLWNDMAKSEIDLVPVRGTDELSLQRKAAIARELFHAEGNIAFLHVHLADDRSDFSSALRVRVRKPGAHTIVEIRGSSAIANTIAWVSEQLHPRTIYIELSLQHPVAQAIKFLLWGEGEIGVMVYQILVNYWHKGDTKSVRPRIVLVRP